MRPPYFIFCFLKFRLLNQNKQTGKTKDEQKEQEEEERTRRRIP
jgi:hypothetical protein